MPAPACTSGRRTMMSHHTLVGSIFTKLPHLDFLAVFFVDLAGSAFFSFLAFSDATNSSNA